MTSQLPVPSTAEPHEYGEALEVLIAAFDGDPAMMAVIAGGSRRQELARLPRHPMTLRVYGNFSDRGRIDISIEESTGKIVSVCSEHQIPRGFLPERTQADWRLLPGPRTAESLYGRS